jgi:WD repeat-containing protein 21A
LLPGHNNCNPLTREGIRYKEMESRRLQLLEEEDKQKKVGHMPPTTASLYLLLKAGNE